MDSTEKQREDRNENRRRGICYMCGREPATNGGMCEKCAEKCRLKQKRKRAKNREEINAQVMERYYARKEKGLCTRCGKRPTYPGSSMCLDCAEKRSRASKMRYYHHQVEKPAGQCRWCTRPCVPGYRLCAAHLAQARANMAKAYTKRDRTGGDERNG